MNHSRVTHFRLRTPIQQMLRAAAVLALVLSTSVIQAQRTPEMVFEPAPGSTPDQASASASGFPRSAINGSPDPVDNGAGGFGVLGRVGHIMGNTVERNQSITYFDLSPFMFVEDTYLFGDGRLFLTNQGHMGGSAGLGMRQYFPRNDFVLGASAWYDRDDSRGVAFQQLGLSLEMFSQWMDVRSNYYWGIGNTVQDLGTTVAPGSGAFSGNNITFSTQTALSTSTDMVDLMFTVPVPGEVAQSINLEASAGWYQIFTPSLNLKSTNGFKLRVDTDFLDRVLHVYSELSQDSFYGTNLVLAADVNYWHHQESRPRLGTSQYNRMSQWVRRNRNVVTRDSTSLNAPEAAINPNTGLPYFVNHVRNVPGGAPLPNFPAPTGTGALLTPFQFIDEAQASGTSDLIFVHADSVYDNRALVMNDRELIVGEGVNQTIPVQALGGQTLLLPVPRATSGTNRPVFQNTIGPAVTLANNNLFAGFDINNTLGTAILGNGITSGGIGQVRINGTTGVAAHGIHFVNDLGQFQLSNVDIANTQGNAFYVNGGSAAIVYDSGTIANTSEFAILVENNSGSVNMAGTTVNDTGGRGVRVDSSSASTTLGILNLLNTTGNALDIQNVSGSVSLFDDILIGGLTGPVGDAIRIQNLTGAVSGLNPVTINRRNAVGINILNMSTTGTVSFADAITMGAPASGGINDHGINFQQNAGSATFNDVNITSSFGSGINIGGILANANTGNFTVTGTTSITGAATSLIALLNDSSNVTFNGITIGNRGDHGIEVLNHSGTTRFLGLSTIRNELLDGAAAVDVRNSSGTIAFGIVNALDTVGPDNGVEILNNTGTVSFGSLSVGSTLTTALDIQNNTSVTIQGGVLDATGARAVTMVNNEAFNVLFDSVSSTASDFGIFVANNIALFDHPGSFSVSGNGSAAASGGTITGQTAAGASFFNVNNVDLRFMDIVSNNVGVLTNDVNDLTLFGDQVTGNTSFGLDALDTTDTLIQQSLFDSNQGFNQVRIVASQLRNATNVTVGLAEYRVIIRNNVFTDDTAIANVGAGDMISISTVASANNSNLELLVENNGRTFSGGFVGFSSNRGAGDAVIGTTWNGNVLATYRNNNIRLSEGDLQVGTRLVSSRASAVNDVVYSGNVFNDGGGFTDTGLLMDFAGRTNLSIIDNFGVDASGNAVVDGFTMDGGQVFVLVDDRAIDLTFRSTNNAIDISRNQITYNSVDGTAILFRAINGPSTVNMDGNTIIMFDDAFLPNERAIVFQNVIGTIGLSSAQNQNNVVLPQLNTTVPLTIPGGVSTGSFLINGFRLP